MWISVGGERGLNETDRQTDKQRDRQIDIYTGRRTDTQTDGLTDRQTDKQIDIRTHRQDVRTNSNDFHSLTVHLKTNLTNTQKAQGA